MAEFQEVIKHWARMLDAHKKGESIALEASVPADAFKDAELVENIVMSWAAENPEPVYPTWWEWFVSFGAATRMVKPDIASELKAIGLLDPIPADIAQQLGIEPKECV